MKDVDFASAKAKFSKVIDGKVMTPVAALPSSAVFPTSIR